MNLATKRLRMVKYFFILTCIPLITSCTSFTVEKGASEHSNQMNNEPEIQMERLELPELKNIFADGETPDYTDAVQANRAFGMDWFEALLTDHGDGNVIVSPYSAAIALAMTFRGADGETFNEIAEALHASDFEEADYHRQQAALLRHLYHKKDDVMLATANSIWHSQALPVSIPFLERMEQYYGATVSGVDFSDPQTPGQMNKWVSDNTMGKIKSIVPDTIEGDPFMYLINALYLKAPWSDPFQKDHTEDEPFRLPDGEMITVPMMKRNQTMQGSITDAFKAVRLGLGDKSELSMTLILPEEGKGWDDVRKALENSSNWLKSFQSYSIELSLPKFRIEQEINLIPSFKQLGIEQVFDSQHSDLARMAGWDTKNGPRLFVDEALQKTFIDVDEDGLEAAAVTSIRAYPTSMPEPMTAIFDRPFYFLIEETNTGSVLFIGTVRDPRVPEQR
ncbi:serpin family protein [Paenibacillus tarimensis]